MSDIIRNKRAGGVIFSGGEPEEIAEMVNFLQTISLVPLFIIQKNDKKPGLNMDSVSSFPGWITLSAVHNDELVKKMGKTVSEQYKRTGVNIRLNSTGEPSQNELIYRESLLENGIIPADRKFPLSFRAGTYIPLSADEPERTVREISEKIRKGILSQSDIDDQCRKILSAKYWAGLSHISAINTHDLKSDLSTPSIEALIYDLYSEALTVVRNDHITIPVMGLDKIKAAAVLFNSDESNLFPERLQDYLPTDLFYLDASDQDETSKTLEMLKAYDLVIGGVFEGTDSTKISVETRDISRFLDQLGSDTKIILACFGNPFIPGRQDLFRNADAILLAYEDNKYTRDLSAQLIFGGIGAKGVLRSAIAGICPAGSGKMTTGNIRLSYALPENAGLSSQTLNSKIDFIARSGLMAGAYPGCEVMVARKGTVVFHKTYGYHTYDQRIPVWKTDLFDLASVTKVSSTLAGLMLLDSEGRFSVDGTLGDYLPDFRRTNKGKLLMKDLLTHQAGLKAWIPFWMETVRKDSTFRRRTFSCSQSDDFPIKVADDLYIHKNYRKKIMNEIKKSPLGPKKYVYSDLTFIISTGIIDNLTGEKWDDYVTRNIYHRLGAYDICFNPYLKYPCPTGRAHGI